MAPFVVSEDVPYDKNHYNTGELDVNRPLGGVLWWNSLYWTNFPKLSIVDEQEWEQNPDADLPAIIKSVNADKRLSEQYVTFGSAREDLCLSRAVPQRGSRLTVECLQYDGVRDCAWDFPLAGYMPRRDNHQPYDIQNRRFWDNGVVHMGLNAQEFSQKIAPLGDVDACIHIGDHAPETNPAWGYYSVVMRIDGWPYRLKRIGTFEGCGDGGHYELNIPHQFFDQSVVWKLLEGEGGMAPTGPNGEMEVQGNVKKGHKFWAQLVDLDWLGPKTDEKRQYAPEIAPEKGYVWFTVEDTITVPSTGQKGVKIRLLEEGIVPAWLDLSYLQVFAGGRSLGYLNGMEAEDANASVKVCRIASDLSDADADAAAGPRSLVVENVNSRIVFNNPKKMQVNDCVDMGWAIHDACFRGAAVKLGARPGAWAGSAGLDAGIVGYKASGAPPLCHGEGANKVIITAPKSDYPYERRLVV